jgi:hypothetical protein
MSLGLLTKGVQPEQTSKEGFEQEQIHQLSGFCLIVIEPTLVARGVEGVIMAEVAKATERSFMGWSVQWLK